MLAFGIDAWWAGQQERREARIVLAALQEDFGSYLEIIQDRRIRNQGVVDAGRLLLSATAPNPTIHDDAQLRGALSTMFRYHPLTLRPGTLGALGDSERRRLIDDLELLELLTDWRQSLEGLNERNEFLRDEAARFIDYLSARYPVQTVPSNPMAMEPASSRFPASLPALLGDPEFENVVSLRGSASVVLLEEFETLERSAQTILDLIVESSR